MMSHPILPASMHLSYETDMALWEYAHTRMAQRQVVPGQLRNAIFTACVGGAIFYVLTPGAVLVKLIAAGCGVLIGMVLRPIMYRKRLRKSIRKVCRKHHAEPDLVDMTIDRSGIRASTPTNDGLTTWTDVAWIDDMDEYVEINLSDGGLIPVPARAFATDDERVAFIALVEQLIEEESDAAPPVSDGEFD